MMLKLREVGAQIFWKEKRKEYMIGKKKQAHVKSDVHFTKLLQRHMNIYVLAAVNFGLETLLKSRLYQI